MQSYMALQPSQGQLYSRRQSSS